MDKTKLSPAQELALISHIKTFIDALVRTADAEALDRTTYAKITTALFAAMMKDMELDGYTPEDPAADRVGVTTGGVTANPGAPVYVLEREKDGAPAFVRPYVLLAVVRNTVLCSPCETSFQRFKDLLQWHMDDTRDNEITELCAFPLVDCYACEDAADDAIEKERSALPAFGEAPED